MRKKISFLIILSICVGLCFTSCGDNEERDEKIQTTTTIIGDFLTATKECVDLEEIKQSIDNFDWDEFFNLFKKDDVKDVKDEDKVTTK